MQAMFDDVPPDDGGLEGLAGERLGVVPGEADVATTAAIRPHVDDLVGLQPDAVVARLAGLPAAPAHPRASAARPA